MDSDILPRRPLLPSIHVGCAGWNLPGTVQDSFPAEGSHLERYAAILPAVEINTCFYRPHRPATYARWRDSVPETFRFAAKLSREITHELRLKHADAPLRRFVREVAHLEYKLGCLLVQLPPRLQYAAPLAEQFFHTLRGMTDVDIACEPRHPSWFATEVAGLLAGLDISYVSADPPVAELPEAAADAQMVYLRLHGSPVVYHSAYPEDYLDRLAECIEQYACGGRTVWCVFDNTASGAAVPNALSLLDRLQAAPPKTVHNRLYAPMNCR